MCSLRRPEGKAVDNNADLDVEVACLRRGGMGEDSERRTSAVERWGGGKDEEEWI
jgi:hypothetical protein